MCVAFRSAPSTIRMSLLVSHPNCRGLAVSFWTICLTYLGLSLSIYKMEVTPDIIIICKTQSSLPSPPWEPLCIKTPRTLYSPVSHFKIKNTAISFSSSTETSSLFQVKTSSERLPDCLAWSPGKSWKTNRRQEGTVWSDSHRVPSLTGETEKSPSSISPHVLHLSSNPFHQPSNFSGTPFSPLLNGRITKNLPISHDILSNVMAHVTLLKSESIT